MTLDLAHLRVLFLVAFTAAYFGGTVFARVFETDHKVFTLGYWTVAALIVAGLPVYIGFVLEVV